MLESRGEENYNLCSSPLKPILFQSKVGSWRSKLIIHDLYLTFNLQVLIVRSLRSRKLNSWVFKSANYQNVNFIVQVQFPKISQLFFYFNFGFTALNKWKYLSNGCHFCCITNSGSCKAPGSHSTEMNFCTFWQNSVAWFAKRMQMCLDSPLMPNLQRIQFIRQLECREVGMRIS